MRSFVRKHPQFALGGGRGRARLYIYEPGDPLSVTLARLWAERGRFVSISEAEQVLARERGEES
jgi:hypothetical protein